MAFEILGSDGVTVLKVDTTSQAAHTTLYDQYGNPMSDVNSLGNVLNGLNAAVTLVLGGQSTAGVNVSGTTGTLTLAFEATIDSTTWFAVTMTPATGGVTVTTTSANGQWVGSVSGYYAFRTRISAFTSGSMTVGVVITPGQSKTGAQSITTAGALSVEITDASSDGPAAVKGASTSAGAADPALVTALSPNTPLPAGTNALGSVTANRTADSSAATQNITAQDTSSTTAAGANGATYITGSPTAGSAAVFALSTEQSIAVQVTGTWTGTVSLECSIDGGTTWFTHGVKQNGASYIASSFTANFIGGENVTGATHFRVRATAAWTGTATVLVRESVNLENLYVGNPVTLRDATTQSITNTIKAASTAAATTDTALVVSVSPNTGQPGGYLPVSIAAASDVFGQVIASQRLPQVQVEFFQQAPANLVTLTTSGSAAATQGTGTGVFSTGITTGSEVTGVSFSTVYYGAQYEIYAAFTAAFTTGVASTYQRIGLYNATDGFSFGFNGATFGLWLRYNGTDTFVAQTSWNVDTLSGATGSKFTSNGSPVALVPTDLNLYRIRMGWLGIAPIYFELIAPDGNFVLVHIFRAPNSQATVTVTNPTLPVTVDVNNETTTSNLTVTCGCWVAGVSSPISPQLNGYGTIAANGAFVQIPLAGHGCIGWQIAGTWTGTIAFQASFDGIHFYPDSVFDSNTQAFVSQTTANNNYDTPSGPARFYRLMATAWVSGTANVTFNGGLQPDIVDTQTFITDANNNGPAGVAPASTAVTAIQPALAVGLSPNSPLYDGNGNPMPVKNRVQMPTTLGVLPASGLDVGLMNRILRVGEIGTTRTTSEIQVWHDALEGSTVNTFWTQSTTTMTIAQSTGVLTLNNSGITTASTDAIITSQRQFPKYPKVSVHGRWKANVTGNSATAQTLVELGFGAPAGTTAIINNGCFFRFTAAGNLVGVVSYNGTETVSATLLAQGSISTTSYYRFDIFVEDQFARFIVTDANDIPVVDQQLQIALTDPSIWAVSHLPTFARVYTTATGGGTTIQLKIGAHDVQLLDSLLNTTTGEQAALMMRPALINPTTYAQTSQLAVGAAPTTITPNNTGSTAYATLGGEYAVGVTVGSENLLGVFGFQVPTPYTFVLTGAQWQSPIVTSAPSVTTDPLFEWFLGVNAASVSPSTGGGQRLTPGTAYIFSAVTAGTVGTLAGASQWQPRSPIACLPGTFINIGYKLLLTSAVTTAGVIRGSVYVDGYWI